MGKTIHFELNGEWFEWDEDKSITNLKERGFDFAYAATAFFDEFAIQGFNRIDEFGEQRFFLIGLGEGDAALLYVAFCERIHNGQQSTRIISSRETTGQERSFYSANRSQS